VIEVRPLTDADRAWATEIESESWGEPVVARNGELVDLAGLPALVALLDGEPAGLATYAVRGDACELVTITSVEEGRGIGRALLQAVREAAASAGCRRLWLVTTNNNIRAFDVFQRFGFDLCELRRHAVDEARRTIKPSISERDQDGVPIAHELELELLLR
jgi:ribosomal protein S18 acetylase RimI-like enzyme